MSLLTERNSFSSLVVPSLGLSRLIRAHLGRLRWGMDMATTVGMCGESLQPLEDGRELQQSGACPVLSQGCCPWISRTLGSGRLQTLQEGVSIVLCLLTGPLGGGGSNSNPYLHSFVCGCLVFLASHVENPVSSHWMILAFILTINWSYMQGLFLGSLFYSIVLYVCLYAIPHGFDYCIFVVRFGIWGTEYFNFILLFQNCFGHFGVQLRPFRFLMGFFCFCKNCYWEYYRA